MQPYSAVKVGQRASAFLFFVSSLCVFLHLEHDIMAISHNRKATATTTAATAKTPSICNSLIRSLHSNKSYAQRRTAMIDRNYKMLMMWMKSLADLPVLDSFC